MSERDLGKVDASFPMVDIESAVVSYAITPRSSLLSLQLALEAFALNVTDINLPVFHQRLTSLQCLVAQLITSGSPYRFDCQQVMLTASDALFQLTMAMPLGRDYLQAQSRVLSEHNPCWQQLNNLLSQVELVAEKYRFEGRITSSSQTAIEPLLRALSEFGQVAFQVERMEAEGLIGVFYLESIQTIEGLNERFPQLIWRRLESYHVEKPEAPSSALVNDSLSRIDGQAKQLMMSGFLSWFQPKKLSYAERDRLLNRYEISMKEAFYQPFANCFDVDGGHYDDIKEAHRFVPFESGEKATLSDGGQAYPLRLLGRYYAVVSDSSDEQSQAPYISSCMGDDVLPSSLYQIDYLSHFYVFDQQESFLHKVDWHELVWRDGVAYVEFAVNQEARLVLSLKVFSKPPEEACLVFDQVEKQDVLIVTVAGRHVAIPFCSVRRLEAFPLLVNHEIQGVKNIWQDKFGQLLLEPWLNAFEINQKKLQKIRTEAVSGTVKKGYYLGRSQKACLIVSAELVADVIANQTPTSFFFVDDLGREERSFLSNQNQCIELITMNALESGFRETNSRLDFSVILEADGLSVALQFASFDWYEEPPSLELRSGRELSNDLEHEDLVVLDKKNYLSFVADHLSSATACK
ncbi:hypothetical protein [Marinomonas posidonica]|uniref:Uncharacterized protein n=1 Tax=Marinomonas posidonica (strain CECT 7376 / NCIMB 14433 / IVIA-Po-181) TaxID=491952 RepID=F6CS77_MARPP|nr:hypothetical protein [Marinomonas posidonica]AEF53864.1 hypothetical protein Mar181_0810 [Marinomonas posidonica IVIA-Po-181]